MSSPHRFKVTPPQCLIAIALVASLCTIDCGGFFKRSRKAENTEPEYPSATGKIQTEATPAIREGNSDNTIESGSGSSSDQKAPPHPDIALSANAYRRAKAAFDHGSYQEAAERFDAFIKDYPGMPGFQDAHAYLGSSWFQLGRYEQALPLLRRTLERPSSKEQEANVLLMLAQSLLFLKQNDEALVATFELMPDKDLEQKLGISSRISHRKGDTPIAPMADRIRAYLLRAQVFAALNRKEDAAEALKKGKRLLEDATDYGISRTAAKKLKGEFAWRELEIVNIKCSQIAAPEKMSEDEFLAYSKNYYDCAEQAKQLICEAGNSKNQDAFRLSKIPYKALVKYPLFLKEHLPPPARKLKDKEAATYYENEMKDLIEKTVRSKTHEFQNIEDCDLFDIFSDSNASLPPQRSRKAPYGHLRTKNS